MVLEGQIVLFAFPQTDQVAGKLRPALVLRALPGTHGDWLICMISSQLHHEVAHLDEVIRDSDPDFTQTGLKTTSLIRVTRIAVISADLFKGSIGKVDNRRLERIQNCLADWLRASDAP